MNDLTPTRSALLELREERQAMGESYLFLDEKRLLLAAEMLAQLRAWERSQAAFAGQLAQARQALRAAVGRHGLDGLQVYPAAALAGAGVRATGRQLLGVQLVEAALTGEPAAAAAAVHPSAEAEHCRGVFLELLRHAAALAALSGNLERLRLEYRRTERRARALEQVLMPELDMQIADLEMRLEETELEEVVRVRHAG